MRYRSNALLRKIVRKKFKALQSRRTNFSVRSFARVLDISHTTLNDFINGKMISKASAAKIAKNLDLTAAERREIFDHFDSWVGLEMSDAEKQEELLGFWVNMAILELLQTKDARLNIRWISQRLRISYGRAKKAIDFLLGIGAIRSQPSGFEICIQEFNVGHALRPAVRRAQKDKFKKAIKFFDQMDEDDNFKISDFSSITFSCSTASIKEAKRRILKFQSEMVDFLESTGKEEVYELCMQFFPLTKSRASAVRDDPDGKGVG